MKERECLVSNCNMSPAFSVRHKRSKSASDKNLDLARHGTSNFLGEECKPQNFIRSHQTRDENQDSSNVNDDVSSDHRVSLENDIKQLQMHLCQEKYIRLMLERAIGRASSTLSPGHRHFTTQTRDLIAEIELLEEEIANREQHVLTLYRSIFEQCISAPSSRQSSGTTSPAQTKNTARKHPSIISSAFCSSKKFSLQPFQVLASMKGSGKCDLLPMRKVRHEMQMSRNVKTPIEYNASNLMKTGGKTYMARTLKDHLFQCPSKLSEELVRCMAAVYCWMRKDCSLKPAKVHSPFLSRSSTRVMLPRRGAGDCQELSCRSLLEISSISIDKNHFSGATYAVSNYKLLVEQLERLDVSALECGAKLAFWINVYNCLVMHAYLAYGVSHGSLRRLALFHKAAYNIGGHIITANLIEHCILQCRAPRVGRWFEAIISTAMRKKSTEEKQLVSSNYCLVASQPLVLFALCSGASSDPTLRVYSAKSVVEELGKAKRDFLHTNVFVKKSRKIFLPKLLDRYAKEAALNCDELLTWVSDNADRKLHDAIQKCVSGRNKKAAQAIEWLPYNAKFRYVFGKDLTEKPWWV
ncbi:hypothetical protein AXF42_Ash005173 [Apostasia shenzhenica]|uniref:DUF547 domain-containing protein n=1 Tax=Apostasia shenzhenica TaxID=1088818 RepID=A0A2I0B8P3_9ASPA|nr:hypothetical protein AXF42_Ash005173 [Apostasia shenzhenica]